MGTRYGSVLLYHYPWEVYNPNPEPNPNPNLEECPASHPRGFPCRNGVDSSPEKSRPQRGNQQWGDAYDTSLNLILTLILTLRPTLILPLL